MVGPSGPDEVSTQVHVHDISGYLLLSGIYVRQNVHVFQITNVDFLPSFTGVPVGEDVWNHVAAEATAVQLDRADGSSIDGLSIWCIGNGIKVGTYNFGGWCYHNWK